ncbi:MAG TPA: hypothetical protein VD926_01585, partial [Acidimicrobiales bacterium]|nr:hypothetical protein [Acidimicrobiales bacterium]
SRWQEVPATSVPDRPPRRWPGIVVPLALALVLALAGRRLLALAVVTATVLVTVLTTLRPTWGERLARGLAAVGTRAADAVSWVLLALVELFVLTPVAAFSRVTRRDPLAAGGTGPSRWEPRPARLPARRTFGPDRRAPVERSGWRRAVAAVPRMIGGIVLLGVANYGAGWTWDELFGSHDTPQPLPETVADLADADVFADDPWAESYWDEYERLRIDPVPYLLTRVADVAGTDISSRDGIRRSYQPAGDDHPEVWFFGGGAAWGEGQRDLHSIPSELARLAEAAGTPVRVVNFGQPGYTTWQTALLVEQQLAVRPSPALMVVYGGADDVGAQLGDPSDAPTHYNAAGVGNAIGARDSAADQARDLWEDYRETSVLTRLARRVGDVFGAQPAHAADSDLVARIEDLRGRSDAVVDDVAAGHDVPVLQVWQAARGVPGDDGAYRSAVAGPEAVDLRAVLDEVADDVYADGVLTDEDGARLVAEALWPRVAEAL